MEEEGETGDTPTSENDGGLAEEEALIDHVKVKQSTMRLKRRRKSVQT